MRRALLLAFAFVLNLAFARPVLADTVTYTFSGDGNQLVGSFSEDQDTQALSGSFSYFDGIKTFTFVGAGLSGGGNTDPSGNYIYNTFLNTSGDHFDLFILNTSGPVVYTLCSIANPCALNASPAYSGVIPSGFAKEFVNTGVLTLSTSVASTPEPSSMVLLGTGLLGTTGIIRRRLSRA